MRALVGALVGSVAGAAIVGALAAIATAPAAIRGPIAATQWISANSTGTPLEEVVVVESADEDS